MHVLFVHQNYPSQFTHIARRLVADLGWKCTFVSQLPRRKDGVLRLVQYHVDEGAIGATHYCSQSFENAIWHTHAVYEVCKRRLAAAPDLIVGHSGFGSTLFLRELFQCPIINYFEYYYHTHNSDFDFRPEFPPEPIDYLRARAGNAMFLLDLDNCDAGYCPTHWQRSLFPVEFHPKLDVIFDGVDTELWQRRKRERRIGRRAVGPRTRIVSYVSWGLEAIRGFDMFMRIARRIYEVYPDVLFVVVGAEHTYYGADERYIQEATFKEHVLKSDQYDLDRFLFLGQIPAARLTEIFSLSDLHIYPSVPFVLSWSVFNALACECVVLASDTAPVREVIRHGKNGLLNDFYDVDGFVRQAVSVLRDPRAFRPLGRAGAELVRKRYSLDYCLPRLARFYQRAKRGRKALRVT
jgi:glycosyltransferase involved in cell wall biosynthesis